MRDTRYLSHAWALLTRDRGWPVVVLMLFSCAFVPVVGWAFALGGRIEGDINCKGKIVIGPKGSILGNIISDNAEVLGDVEGSIRIKEKLVFKSTAIIKGDIFTQTLEIEPGAHFNGTCTMSGKMDDLRAPQHGGNNKSNVTPLNKK